MCRDTWIELVTGTAARTARRPLCLVANVARDTWSSLGELENSRSSENRVRTLYPMRVREARKPQGRRGLNRPGSLPVLRLTSDKVES